MSWAVAPEKVMVSAISIETNRKVIFFIGIFIPSLIDRTAHSTACPLQCFVGRNIFKAARNIFMQYTGYERLVR